MNYGHYSNMTEFFYPGLFYFKVLGNSSNSSECPSGMFRIGHMIDCHQILGCSVINDLIITDQVLGEGAQKMVSIGEQDYMSTFSSYHPQLKIHISLYTCSFLFLSFFCLFYNQGVKYSLKKPRLG